MFALGNGGFEVEACLVADPELGGVHLRREDHGEEYRQNSCHCLNNVFSART